MATSQYITQQYQELLGRAPDSGGMAHYLRYSDPNAVRNEILGSDEYKGRQTAASAPAPAAPDPAAAERAALEQQVSGLFGELGTADNAMHSPVDTYNAALESLGLSDARTRVSGLREQLLNNENLLKNVEGDVSARTADSLVTENQRRRLVATEQAPISGQIDAMSGALQGALGDYNTILGEGKTQADLTFQGDQAKRQGIMDRLKIAIDRSSSAEDKRRWQTELDRLQAQDAEAKRQFDVSTTLKQQELAASAAKSSSSSSSSKKANQSDAQKQVADYITTSGQRGKDGYLSPVTFKQLEGEWTAAGWNASDFDSAFKQYANPSHLKDYGL